MKKVVLIFSCLSLAMLLPAVLNGELARALNGPFWKPSDFGLAVSGPAEGVKTLAPGQAQSCQVQKTVKPGLVNWQDFDSACMASAKSGKPVILFQMLGRLDQKFC